MRFFESQMIDLILTDINPSTIMKRGDPMESLTKFRQTSTTIQAMVKHIFQMNIHEHEEAIKELTTGWFNVAYEILLVDGRSVILKIAPNPNVSVMTYERGMMTSEVEWMRKVSAIGIPCPLVLGYDNSHTICPADYFFMTKLPGQNLEHCKEHIPPNVLNQIHFQIGQWTQKWHSITHESYFGYPHQTNLQDMTWRGAYLKMLFAVLEDGIRNQVDIGFDYDNLKALIVEISEPLDDVKTPHFIHWDVWDSNVFVENNRVTGILDFERGFWGDPLAEALFRMKHPDQLAGYGQTIFTQSEQERMHLYDLYLYLIMVIEDSYRHYDTPDIKNYALSQLQHLYPILISSKEKGDSH